MLKINVEYKVDKICEYHTFVMSVYFFKLLISWLLITELTGFEIFGFNKYLCIYPAVKGLTTASQCRYLICYHKKKKISEQ